MIRVLTRFIETSEPMDVLSDICFWLCSNIGPQCGTSLRYGKGWTIQEDRGVADPQSIQLLVEFKDPKKALMFKLVWG